MLTGDFEYLDEAEEAAPKRPKRNKEKVIEDSFSDSDDEGKVIPAANKVPKEKLELKFANRKIRAMERANKEELRTIMKVAARMKSFVYS